MPVFTIVMPPNNRQLEEGQTLPKWENMSEPMRELVAKSILANKRWKFIAFAISSISVVSQPILSSYYTARAEDRRSEIIKIEKTNEQSTALSRLTLESLMTVSNQLSNIKSEKESLKKELDELKSQIKANSDSIESHRSPPQ